MKFSKEGLLTITGLLVIGGVTLMTTTSAKDLKIDLKNAIQHIGSVEFIKKGVEGKVSISATSDGKLNVSGDNLIFTNSSNNSISSSDKSNILGGSSNKIETSTGSTIIAGNTNEIKDAELSVIGGGQRNTVKGNYSVIAGGFGNNIAQDSSYSSILGGAGNALKGNYSSIVGNNNSLTGNNSVIFGSRGNLNANNSFLWTDGKQAKGLNESNVFAVLSENGMVINSNQANSNAQLTIGGSLRIAENVEKDNQVECQNGKGKGILKVMPKNDGSDQKCFCSCNGNSWDSMFGDGRCEGVCKGGLEPICGTTVSSKKVGEDFYMSGSCNQGKVVEGSGSYYVSNNWKNNKSTLHWTCQTDDGQTKACSGDIVGYDYKPVPECKNLPANAVPNNEKIPSYNMNYRYSMNVDVVCSFKCKAGYRWNQSKQICESATTTFQCRGTVPGNATLVAGSDQNLTANTTRTLYANAAAANGKKCAYLCNAGSEYNSVLKMCINKSSYCKATHYECESPAVATNKKVTSTEYTWDCAIDGTTVSAGCSEVKTETGQSCGKCGSELYSCSKGVVSNTGYSDNKATRQCKGTDSTVKCEMEGVLAPQPFCPEDYIMENGTCKLNAKYCGKIKAVGNDGSNINTANYEINTANYEYKANGQCFGKRYTGHLEQAYESYGQPFPARLENKNNNGSRGSYGSSTDGVWLSEYINNQNKPSQCHDSHDYKGQIMNSPDHRRFKEYGCVLTNYGLGATDDGYTLTCTKVSSTPCFSKPIGGVTVKETFLSGNSACK